MSVVALAGGVALYLHAARATCSAASRARRLLRRLKGQRIFERVLVTLSWRLARWLEDLLGTRRLQPQLRLLVVRGARRRAWCRSTRAGSRSAARRHGDLDLAFALVWAVGIACALGAA